MRAHSNEHGDSLPVLDVSSLKHVAYVLDALVYYMRADTAAVNCQSLNSLNTLNSLNSLNTLSSSSAPILLPDPTDPSEPWILEPQVNCTACFCVI